MKPGGEMRGRVSQRPQPRGFRRCALRVPKTPQLAVQLPVSQLLHSGGIYTFHGSNADLDKAAERHPLGPFQRWSLPAAVKFARRVKAGVFKDDPLAGFAEAFDTGVFTIVGAPTLRPIGFMLDPVLDELLALDECTQAAMAAARGGYRIGCVLMADTCAKPGHSHAAGGGAGGMGGGMGGLGGGGGGYGGGAGGGMPPGGGGGGGGGGGMPPGGGGGGGAAPGGGGMPPGGGGGGYGGTGGGVPPAGGGGGGGGGDGTVVPLPGAPFGGASSGSGSGAAAGADTSGNEATSVDYAAVALVEGVAALQVRSARSFTCGARAPAAGAHAREVSGSQGPRSLAHKLPSS
jgi:hypothetical protein